MVTQTHQHQRLTPQARLQVFMASAPMPMLQETERYLAALREFLQDDEGSH